MNNRTLRRVYLVTCSHVDRGRFPERVDFAEAVVEAFNSGVSQVRAEYWACCLENHVEGGEHYHVCIKLSGPKRWLSAKNFLLNNYETSVHFSNEHDNYYQAYRYVTKSDTSVFHSENHPNLQNMGAPRTAQCVRATRMRRAAANNTDEVEEAQQPQAKVQRLSNLEVAEFLVEHNIKNDTQLFAEAHSQKSAGKKDLANFLLCRSSKAINDLIDNTWRMESAQTELDRANVPRMDVLMNCSMQECLNECNGVWGELARQVLQNNNIAVADFSSAVRDLLQRGRGKYRNILIVGPANCGKTFLLKPLVQIYKTFSNPAVDKFAWTRATEADIIFLNDFRWERDLISWKELLLLLEGEPVHLPAPKTFFKDDACLTKDTPIFATSKSVITFKGPYNARDGVEDEMMASRWKVFKFTYQIPQERQRDIPACPRCFADLVLH